MGDKKRVFLDYASATPILPEVFKAMHRFFSKDFSNASALYKEGVIAKNAIKLARENIARILRAHSDEIVFTASGTESNNLAIFGLIESLEGRVKNPHIIASSFEHPAVMEALLKMEKRGYPVTYLPVDRNGFVSLADLKKNLRDNTVLVTIMYANNEIGTIQPLREISKTIRLFKENKIKNKTFPYFHTDASQAGNYLSLKTSELHVDLMTLDASKLYGPKGIGLLYVRKGVEISPIIVGGGQEMGLRSGTENVPLIIGFSKALSVVQSDSEAETRRLMKLRNYLASEIKKAFPKSQLNGSLENRLPNNVNVCFPNIDGEFAVIQLDAHGIAVSSSSSCRSLSENVRSYVVESLGRPECSESSLRFTLGRETRREDIVYLLKILKKIIS